MGRQLVMGTDWVLILCPPTGIPFRRVIFWSPMTRGTNRIETLLVGDVVGPLKLLQSVDGDSVASFTSSNTSNLF